MGISSRALGGAGWRPPRHVLLLLALLAQLLGSSRLSAAQPQAQADSLLAEAQGQQHQLQQEQRQRNLQLSTSAIWAKFMKDNSNSGRTSQEGKVISPFVSWTVRSGGAITASPVIASDGTIYVGSYDAFFRAISPAGSVIWSLQPGNSASAFITATAAIDVNGNLLFGDWAGNFHSITPQGTRNPSWTNQYRAADPKSIVSSAALSSTAAFFGSDDCNVYAVSLTDGRLLWPPFKTGDLVESSPALGTTGISAGILYIGSFDKFMYALDADTGRQIWKNIVPSRIVGSAALSPSGSVVYYSTANATVSFLYAAHAGTGAVIWQAPFKNAIWQTPAIDPSGNAYISTQAGLFFALDAITGRIRWTYTVGGGQVSSSAAITGNGVLYFGCTNSKVVALNSANGAEIWTYVPPALAGFTTVEFQSSIAMDAAGDLYFGANDYNLYKLTNAPPSPPPSIAPTAMPTFTRDPTAAPTPLPSGVPTVRPTDVPTALPTPRPSGIPSLSPTSAAPTAIPTYQLGQGLSETSVAMSADCRSTSEGLVTPVTTFMHLQGPNPTWFLTVQIYGTGVNAGSVGQGRITTTINGQVIPPSAAPDIPLGQTFWNQPPACFCPPGIVDCLPKYPVPEFRQSIVNYRITANMIQAADGGSINLRTTATGFCQSACPYQGLYDLYVRYNLFGAHSGPTLQPTVAGVTPTLQPSALPTLVPTFAPTSFPTTPFPTRLPTLSPTTRPPTAIPTLTPTFYKATTGPTSAQPTFAAWVPTPSPSRNLFPLICPPYVATGTDSVRRNYASCQIWACPGQTFTVGDCENGDKNKPGGSCQGDQFIRVFGTQTNPSDEVGSNDDYCGLCSQVTITIPQNYVCQIFEIREGCGGMQTCGGVMAISGDIEGPNAVRLVPITPSIAPTALPTQPTQVPSLLPSAIPSLTPSYAAGAPTPFPSIMPTNPTANPTAVPTPGPTSPTQLPTSAPTYLPGVPTPLPTLAPSSIPTPFPSPPPTLTPSQATIMTAYCPLFTATLTNAQANNCVVRACGGVTFTVSTCPSAAFPMSACVGPVDLRLNKSGTRLRTTPTAACGSCPGSTVGVAGFSYTVPTNAPCDNYVIVETCLGAPGSVCQANVAISYQSPATTLQMVTLSPTAAPTNPTAIPTAIPTFAVGAPVPEPTPLPLTMQPSPYPSLAPTVLAPPTPAPSATPVAYCPEFAATGTDTDTINPQVCGIQVSGPVCSGVRIVATTCNSASSSKAYCAGNTVLRLFDQNMVEQTGSMVRGVPGGACGTCDGFTFTTAWNAPCQTYFLNQGCIMGGACAGVTAVNYDPTNNVQTLAYTPTRMPTAMPTAMPDVPTSLPIANPTAGPTLSPAPSAMPSPLPSADPTAHPTSPTPDPTAMPSFQPGAPTPLPSPLPSAPPSVLPSAWPTTAPTTASPSVLPTPIPSASPTTPSAVPTPNPTYLPGVPTPKPTDFPVGSPSDQPTLAPTVSPTIAPSLGPTFAPSMPTQPPTQNPTFGVTAPTPEPTPGVPSFSPSVLPTVMPSPLLAKIDRKTCPLFQARLTNSDRDFAPVCGLYACPGVTFTISMCPNTPGTRCVGDPMLRLFAQSNQSFVAMNNNGPVSDNCGLCPELTFSTTLPCQMYLIHEGCMGNGGCGGSATISAPFETVVVVGNGSSLIPLYPPTLRPTSMPPTKKPSRSPTYLPNDPTPLPTAQPTSPTSPPTQAPTMPYICPPYSVNNTNNAQDAVRTATCSIYACPGTPLTIGSCLSIQNNGGVNRCVGDEYLRLFNSAGTQVAFNDNSCGLCSQIVFTPSEPCQVYTLREGCAGNAACSGQPLVFGGQMAPMQPTIEPTAGPTSTLAPTLFPSAAPSYLPGKPTPQPTAINTDFPTLFNFFTPTTVPSYKPLACRPFFAHNTDTDSNKFSTCGIYACPGTTFTASTCKGNFPGARCIGDTYLQLFAADGANSATPSVLASNDNGPWNCGLCSEFTYTTTLPCQIYVIAQGCMGQGNCAGNTVLAGNTIGFDVVTFNPTMKGTQFPSPNPSSEPSTVPTPAPSVWPTYVKNRPTPLPSALPTAPSPQPSASPTQPSPVPTLSPTTSQICPPYTASMTRSNTMNYAICSFSACQGAQLLITSCNPSTGLQSASCVGDQMYALYDQSGYLKAENDNTCGLCSQISFTVTDPGCQVYGLRQGCSGNSTCGGTTIILGTPVGSYWLATMPGTQVPTVTPTAFMPPSFLYPPSVPTPEPTFLATTTPLQVQKAPPYFADLTFADTIRTPTVGVYACPGTTFTVSTCPVVPGAFCVGDTYLRMFGSDGTLVAENDNGPPPCGLCAQFTFTAVGSCQTYSVAEGCASNRACNGVTAVQSTPQSVVLVLFSPTQRPTSSVPTTLPTADPTALPGVPTNPPTPNPTSPTPSPTTGPTNPTRTPTALQTLTQFCPPYSTANTNYALDRTYVTCSITACGGSLLNIGNCASPTSPTPGCVGDQYIRLFEPSGLQVAENNKYCGLCAQISYLVPLPPDKCQTYILREGCWGNTACGGVMSVAGGIISPTPPTPMPTLTPSMAYIVMSPTFGPTPTAIAPTVEPTPSALTCANFVAGQTADNTIGFSSCGIYACAGTTFTVSTCPNVPGSSCDGDTFLTLINANGTRVAFNDDGEDPSCGLCSMFTFTTTDPCQTYVLREGCAGDDACRGTVAVAGTTLALAAVQIVDFSPTQWPTRAPTRPTTSPTPGPSLPPSFGPSVAPSYLPDVPTPLPTLAPTSPTERPTPRPSNPTNFPTLQPTFGQICPPYTASTTNSGLQNYAVCSLYACPGTTLTISNCGAGCVGDMYLRLYDGVTSSEIASNDDGCGGGSLCSRMVFTTPSVGTCRTYFIHEGCHGDLACEGVVNFIGLGGSQPAVLATAVPTPLLTPAPSSVLTLPPGPIRQNVPSATPTVMPTWDIQKSQYCLAFQGQRNMLGQLYPFCSVYICPGTTMTLSMCSSTDPFASCSGDSYMKLYDASGELVAANDDGPPGCGRCSQITYSSNVDSCQIFTVIEGCQGSEPCSGTLAVLAPAGAVAVQTTGPTSAPTVNPASPAPTPLPSVEPSAHPTPQLPTPLPDEPTSAPSDMPTFAPSPQPTGPTQLPTMPLPEICPPYIGFMTNTTHSRVTHCALQVCPGQHLVMGGCAFPHPQDYNNPVPGPGCQGDQYLRLFDDSDEEVAVDDDTCGMCAQITYTVPGTPDFDKITGVQTNCVTYVLDQGCYGNSTCAGATQVYGGAFVVPPPGSPTPNPSSVSPTAIPSPFPTSESPTTAIPTAPSPVPSPPPTFLDGAPTPQPSIQPSPPPSNLPTRAPTSIPTVEPSPVPSLMPTQPTAIPTLNPTYKMSDPTPPPTTVPSSLPTERPTDAPTVSPTASPTNSPTLSPTASPTLQPSAPSPIPTTEPTYLPASPTPQPTTSPSPLPSLLPTPIPSVADTPVPSVPPTVEPTSSPSPVDTFQYTSQPTVRGSTYMPTVNGVVGPCPTFGTVDTDNGRRNTIVCGIYMCTGATVTLSNCPNVGGINAPPNEQTTCVGDTLLRLVDSGGREVAVNDNAGSFVPGCGKCSQITYTPPGAAGNCQVYALNQGCAGGGRCGGKVSISGVRGTVQLAGVVPTPVPTQSPSSFRPSPAPSVRPTVLPSMSPTAMTKSPTRRPTPRKTSKPTRRGETYAPSRSWEGVDIYAEITSPAGPLRAVMGSFSAPPNFAGAAFGRAMTFDGLTLIVGSPNFNSGGGLIQLFDCTPMTTRVATGCTFASNIVGPSQSQLGASVSAGYVGSKTHVLAAGMPGVQSVKIVDINSITTPSSKIVLKVADWGVSAVRSSFGATVGLFQPVYTGPAWTASVKPLVLTVSDPTGGTGGAGCAYVYLGSSATLGSWSQAQTLTPSSTTERMFGEPLAKSSNGLLALGSTTSAGIIVYVYMLPQSVPTFSRFDQIGVLLRYPIATSSSGFAFSLAVTTRSLALGVPTANGGIGTVVVYQWDDNSVAFLQTPVGALVPDTADTVNKTYVGFGQSVALTNRQGAAALAVVCTACGADSRGGTYIYICASPATCGAPGMPKEQVLWDDNPGLVMDSSNPSSRNAVAFSSTGAILAVGAPASFGTQGAVLYWNAARFPFFSSPSASPTIWPTPEPSSVPTFAPSLFPTTEPTPTSPPTMSAPLIVTIVVRITLNLPSFTSAALKNTLDTDQAWQAVIRGAVIETLQGQQYLRSFNMQSSVTPLPPLGMELDSADRKLQASSGTGTVYLKLTVEANMYTVTGNTPRNQFDSAYDDVQGDFVEALLMPSGGGPNKFTTLIRTLSSNPRIPLSGASALASGSTDNPSTWSSMLGLGYSGTFPPSPGPTPEPTRLPPGTTASPSRPPTGPSLPPTLAPTYTPGAPTPEPSPAPSVVPTSASPVRPPTDVGGQALGSIGSGAASLSPAALGGIIAGGIIIIAGAAFLFFQKQCGSGSKDEDDDGRGQQMSPFHHEDEGMSGDMYHDGGDEDEYVERPSGGVEMLENPVFRRASQQPFGAGPARGGQDDDAMSQVSQMDGVYDQERAGGNFNNRHPAPPPRAQADPYQRFGFSAPPPPGMDAQPMQRLSMSVRGGMMTEITGPPLTSDGSVMSGMTGVQAPLARSPLKRFSVAPTLAEFSQGQGVTARLGAPRADLAPGPMPPAPRHLKPFQPHSPTVPAAPMQQRSMPPHSITLTAPSRRLTEKLQQQQQQPGDGEE